MELSNKNGGKTNCKKFKVQIWPWFLTYWPRIERGPSQAMVNTSVKYHYCMPKINGYHVETIQSLKTKFDLVLWSCDPKTNRGPSQVEVNTFVKYHYCMPKVNGAVVRKRLKKFKVQISPLTVEPKINRGPPRVKVNIYVKYHHCMSNGRGVFVQKPLFHGLTDGQTDRQTDSYGETSIPPQLSWRGYTNLFSMWRNRWKMTPLEVKISWGESLFHDLWFKI